MANESLIHLKFEYSDAVEGKKDILLMKRSSLRMIRALKGYHALRIDEFDAKEALYKNVRELSSISKKLERLLPKVKIPKPAEEKEVKKEKPKKIKKKKKEKKKAVKIPSAKDSIEYELEEINGKLKSLERLS